MTDPDTAAAPPRGWIDWTALERALPLDDLPDLHRALLERHRPDEDDWSEAFLRKVQGKVQATLAALEREERAVRDGRGHLWLEPDAVPAAWRGAGRDPSGASDRG